MSATPPPLAKVVGPAERTLQALLQAQLARAGLGIPEWTVLTFLGGPRPLGHETLIEQLDHDRIADSGQASALLDAMAARGLIAPVDGGLAITAAGSEVFLPLRTRVANIVATLVEGIPASDLDATQRTLDLVARRATGLLGDAS